MRRSDAKRHPLLKVALIILAVIVMLAVVFICNIPKPQPQQVSDNSFDLSALDDGIYYGECSNSLVFAKVEVDVQDHTIGKIRIIEQHRNGMGESAEVLAEQVVTSQSIELDAVTGATYNSQTLLKAIENALSL